MTTNVPRLEDRLTGWKEIAAYLGRSPRTVQRWEKVFGLPVHRIAGGPGDSVYAYRSELDTWRQAAQAQAAMLTPPADPLDQSSESAFPPVRRLRGGCVAALVIIAGLLALVAMAVWRRLVS